MKFDRVQQFFFFGLLLATTGVFLWMLGGYLMPVFWALVIAIVFYPWYLQMLNKLGGRATLASLLTVLSVVLVILIPLVIIGGVIVQESLDVYQQLNEDSDSGMEFGFLERLESFAGYLEPYGISKNEVMERIREWTSHLTQVVASGLLSFSQMTFSLIIHTLIALYLLFFFLRDGKKLQNTLIYYLPLGDEHEKKLFTRFTETSRAVVKGTLTIAALQGVIGGLAFWIAGISNPVLWGVAMAVLSLIPAVGAVLVWLPAGIILLLTGSIWQGVVLLAIGVLVISMIDEFLRPILVGRGSKMPDSITLLATIGGLATFGISGFVVGPIIAAFFLSLWIMFGERYCKELSNN